MRKKKYQSEILQEGDRWTARITRQITSRKSIVSKQQGEFMSETEAQEWVQTNLAKFVDTQKNANSRQSVNRKEQEEVKRQRSSRRAKKTEATKLEKAESAVADAQLEAQSTED